MCQCGEDSSDCAAGALHASSNYSDKSQVRLQIDHIRLNCAVDAGDHRLLILFKFVLVYHNGHGVDP